MPRTLTITKEVYTFAELSESAKERARDWWRRCEMELGDTFWSESVIEDAATVGALMGIDLNQRPVKLMGGGTRYEPAIYWSGFSSQGDGACFECSYAYKAGSVAAVAAHVGANRADQATIPESSKRLVRIAQALADAQRPFFYSIEAQSKHRGHDNHEFCMDIDVYTKDSQYVEPPQAEEIRDALRNFARWIYRELESAYEWTMSNEQVDESIICNEYEFTEEGKIA